MILKIANFKPQGPQDILAADIGATKTTIAICHWDGNAMFISKEATYKTKSFRDMDSLISNFVSNENIPGKICLGVAGPVQGGKAILTNINLEIDGEAISKNFHASTVLINDLEAAAYGLGILDPADLHVLHEGEDKRGNAAIISPGTGLGEAGLFYGEEGLHPFATEGGHCDFAPRLDIDIELFRFMRKEFGHVSWERMVSGPGICMIYDFLHQEMEREESVWIREMMQTHDKASVITANAGECEICRETTELFIRYLAEESGNLVLKFKAVGGLYISGGILPELLPVLHEDHFMKWFIGFGRLKNLLQAVPVKIVLNKKLPLLGAAYYGVHQLN